MRNISKKRITLGTKQYVPMFEQFLNESEEMEDEDMEMEEPRGGEDEEMEEDDMESGEGSEELEEEEKEVEERIQEAYRRGLAKGRKLGRVNESEQPPFPEDVTKYMSGAVNGFKAPGLLALHLYNKKTGADAEIKELTKSTSGSKLMDWAPTEKTTVNFSSAKQGTVEFYLNRENIYLSVISIGAKDNENAFLGNYLSDAKFSGTKEDKKATAIAAGKLAPKNLPLS